MRSIYIITAFLIFTLAACTQENISKDQFSYDHVNITGSSTVDFSDNSSRAESISNLKMNDSIIFSSTGGITADRDTLIYNGTKWDGLKSKRWEANNESADFCALHPILEEYNETNLYYSNNELKDIICCKSTSEYGSDITLSFKHLFSKIQIIIDDELNRSLENLYINVPYSVENIDIRTGEISVNNNIKKVMLERNETSKYEIFVPACSDQTIPFELTTTDGNKYSATINHTDYISSYQYVCNIKYNNGIYTKEDFIAFTYLINGEEYDGRTLDEFFIIKDGKRVFNLFTDLHFTEEETRLIRKIGTNGKEFDDVFDGNNHIISGITYIADNYTRESISLFENTTVNSIIRNITLDDVSIIENEKEIYGSASFFVGYNEGLIDNCNIKNGTIKINSNKETAGICVTNNGYIINSTVEHFSIIKESGSESGFLSPLCIGNNAAILNCNVNYEIDCNIRYTELVSAICHRNYNTVENAYTYGYLDNNNIIRYINKNSINNNIFYDYRFTEPVYKNEGASTYKFITHNNTPEDYIKNVDELNNWIDTEGKTKYPQFDFKRWVTDGTSAPKLE